MKATDETKQAAKAAGIKSWHVKSEETLREELGLTTDSAKVGKTNSAEVGTITVNSADTANIDSNEISTRQKSAKLPLILPTDIDKKTMQFSVKCVGEKSPYWKYRDML